MSGRGEAESRAAAQRAAQGFLMTDEKTRRIKKAMDGIHEKARVKDATQLRGRVKVVTSSTILKFINEIIAEHAGDSNKEILIKLTEAEFELLKLRNNSQVLRADLEKAREESFAKDTTIKELTDQLAQTLAMAERRENEVRQLSQMIQDHDREYAVQVEQLRASLEELKSPNEEAVDPDELIGLREELSALQSELRMSEDIEEMQRSEIANIEGSLESMRSDYEAQVGGLSRKIDQLERDLHASRELEKEFRAKLSKLAKPAKQAQKPELDFGMLAVQLGYCSEEQVLKSRQIRKDISEMGLEAPKLSEVLVDKGFISQGQVTEILRAQGSIHPRIEGYKFVSKLGEGLLGATYRARQVSLDREVAVKIIRREFSADKEYTSRFLDQAKQAGRLHHKNIAHVIDAGQIRGICFCISEYVRGQNLREIVRKKGKLTERQVLHIGLETAYALAEAHSGGLVHGNLKPSNIIVNAEGIVKVCDFGLSRHINLESEFTLPSTLFDIVYYTSPEAVRGGSPDIRSDIYSLGATLFRLATGSYPFGKAATPREALLAHLSNTPPDPMEKNPEIGKEIAQVIARMLEPEPDDRYQEPTDLISAFVELIKRKKASSPARPVTRRRHTRRRLK